MHTNTVVNPRMKPSALIIVFAELLSPPPAKYVMYIGSIGRRQGEMKVSRPSRKAIM
jgi:hypothetical protein